MKLDATLATLAAATSGVTAAVYLNFSARVMPRLAKLPDAQAISTMQQFNRRALQPPFMICFFGAAAVGVTLIVRAALAHDRTGGQAWAAAGSALYLAGFALTIGYNVPRNEALAAAAPDAESTVQLWHAYVKEWTTANTVRAVLSTASVIACGVAATRL